MKNPGIIARCIGKLGRQRWMHRLWMGVWRRRFVLRVTHEERVPRDRPVILAGNQASHFDGPFAHTIVLGMFGRPGVAVADPCVMQYPVVRELISSGTLRCILVEKSPDRPMARAEVILQMIDAIEAGENVVINPEGDPFDEIGEFQPGAAYAAIATGAPIAPFTLLGTRGLFSAQPWPSRYSGNVSAVFHEPVWPGDFALPGVKRAHAARAMMQEVRNRVAGGLRDPAPAGVS